MSTPTPRTDAAVKLTFAAGHNTVCPNFARTLERELTALTAERDQLRSGNVSYRLERDKAEAERTDAIYQRVCEVERELRAENATLRSAQKACEACDEPSAFEVRQLRARAERAEANETVALANWNGALERAMKAEAELAAAKERLRSEAMDDYASIKDLQRELATEREKVRLLKFDKDRLDWYNGESYYQFGKSHKCMDSGWWWSCGYQQNNGKSGIQNIRDTIDSAMAHSKSGRNKYNVCKRIEDSIKEGAK